MTGLETRHRWLIYALLALLMGVIIYAWPNGYDDNSVPDPKFSHISLEFHQGLYGLNADIELNLHQELKAAAEKGVPLAFTFDFEVYQPRTFRWDKVLLSQQQTWVIQYNALLRQWSIRTGMSSFPESSLQDCLLYISKLRNWPINNLGELPERTTYYGRLRLRLDTSLLPRPFQINALNNSAWSLSTSWKSFKFHLSVH